MSWKRRIDQWKKYLTVRAPFCRETSSRASRSSDAGFTAQARGREYVRRSILEALEPRNLFNADPIWVGGVFIEEDMGSDLTPDRFFIQFKGGAENTRLTKIVIDTDQMPLGWSRGDIFFDTEPGGRGADYSHPFRVVPNGKFSEANVRAEVEDGGKLLVIYFDNFMAGDVFEFTIDVDEVQYLEDADNLDIFNRDVDPVVSGVEFARSRLTAHFVAPHYEDALVTTAYVNEYDFQMIPSGLDLPLDDDNGLRDRTAGTAVQLVQTPKPISLAGTVFVDNNLNLIRDPGEVGIANVPLSLYRFENGQYVPTGHQTVTNAQGHYVFGTSLGLMPGKYQIRQTQPTGFFSVGAIPGLLDGTGPLGATVSTDKDILIDIEVPLGDTHGTNLDFAEAQPIEISGFVYHDRNNNGIKEAGEEGIGDVEIQIISISSIGAPVSQTIRTAADGSYRLTGLPPGLYRIVQTQPAGYIDGKDALGRVNGQPRGTMSNDLFSNIRIDGNEVAVEYNFGELLPATISGTVYHDANDDGIMQPNEVGIPNALVRLVASDGSITEKFTDAFGRYSFGGLHPGTYTIIQTTPVGFLDGKDRVGTINGQIVGVLNESDVIGAIAIASGQQGVNYDFGEIRPSSLAGQVFEDINGDSIRNPGEPSIVGVKIELLNSNGTVVAVTHTDAQGRYQFNQLRPGTYSVRQTQPDGYIQGGHKAGTAGGDASITDLVQSIVLGQDIDAQEYDFWEQRHASLFGAVFVDTERNCTWDPGEEPLAGVKIELLNGSGAVIATTFTDANGHYRFDNLVPGTYTVRQTQPDGYFHGGQKAPPGVGLTDQADLIRDVRLLSGQNQGELNFCEVPPAEITGFVFQDGVPLVTPDGAPPPNLQDYKTGVRGQSSIPIAGVRLQLRTLTGQQIPSANALPGIYDGEFIEVITDENGFYEFKGLREGAYHVYQIQPIGYFDGIDQPGSTFGSFAVNPWFELDPMALGILSMLTLSAETDPGNDAILMINLMAGARSVENNFSEILVTMAEPPPPEDPPAPPPPPRPNLPEPPLSAGTYPGPIDRYIVLPPILPAKQFEPIGGYKEEFSWQLSIINAGLPRGHKQEKAVTRDKVKDSAVVLNPVQWTIDSVDRGRWTYVSTNKVRMTREAFNVLGAKQLAGDFNGDGRAQIALFKDGEWLIDINGNGIWDEGDLWIKLGEQGDRPIVGDWDGDGKDDIGVYGNTWRADELTLEREPGLPDATNQRLTRPKNLPPDRDSVRERLMQRSSEGTPRSDEVDHVFRFGSNNDTPVAGDFNGDGISTVGLFNAGHWTLDTDGDGRLTEKDSYFQFGQAGDIPVVGDFDGDGIDEIAVVRGNKLIVDSNGNGALDAADKVFEIEGEGEDVIVGDFDGDGIDEVAFYLNLPVSDQADGYTAARP
ncbi:SdrD B-like domain-containing protein [Pirellulaceae bacterium SH449]